MKAILESANEGIYGMDEYARCTFINTAALEFLGYSEAECLGQNMHELVHYKYPDGTPYPKEACPIYQALLAGKPLRQIQEVLWHKDGHPLPALYSFSPILQDGRITGSVVTIIDLRERVDIENALSESKYQLELALEAGRLGSWELDLATQTLKCSTICKANFGLPANADFSYSRLFESIVPEDRTATLAAIQLALDTHSVYEAEYRVQWPDRSIHWIMARGIGMYSHNSMPYRMVGITIDISAQKLAEQQKDEFFAVVAHELKTPVTAARGFLQLSMRRLMKSGLENEAEMLNKSVLQMNHLNSLINDLLDFSRIQLGRFNIEKRNIDLVALLQRVCESLQSTTIRHTIHLQTPEQLIIPGEEQRLEQVLMNLLGNAIKYSPYGGDIDIRIDTTETEALVSIRDYGIGIPAEDRLFIFDRFRRAHNTSESNIRGFGIGLHISREIVLAHGGRIWLAESLGSDQPGSLFYIALPLA